MAVSLNAERIRRGGRGGGDFERMVKGVGGGPGSFYREDIRRGLGGSELEGDMGRQHQSRCRGRGRVETGEQSDREGEE